MPGEKTILIIDLDDNSNRTLQVMLQDVPGVEIETETEDLQNGVDLIDTVQPMIVILNIYPSEEQAFRIARLIKENHPEVILFLTSKNRDSKVIINAMRLGAQEYLIQPIKKEELLPAVHNAIRKKTEKNSAKHQSKVITCFGAKGGIGTTTVAANVATFLARHTKKEVLLLDLNLQFGNTAVQLDIKPQYSIHDIINHLYNLDETDLKSMITLNAAGVSVLTGPSRIEDAEAITTDHIEQVITTFKNYYPYIVIDTRSYFDDMIIKVMDLSDHIFMITVLDVPTTVNTKRCLDIFQRMGYKQDKVQLVVNRHGSNQEVDEPAMEKLYDYPISWRIPNQDFRSVIKSINKGMPIIQMHPEAKLSQSIAQMALQFNGSIPVEEAAGMMSRKPSFLKKVIKS